MPSKNDWLALRAQRSPEKTALIFEGQAWSYRQLHERVDGIAAALQRSGVEPGDRVAAALPNRVEFVGSIHALARIGAVLVPLNIRQTAHELAKQVETTRCSHVLFSETTSSQAAVLTAPGLTPVLIDPAALRSARTREAGRAGRLAGKPLRPTKKQALQSIVFTSGTSGASKGALLTFENHLWSASASAFRLGVDPADSWLACLPLYHVGGMAIVFRSCLYGTTIVLKERFDPHDMAETILKQRITLVSLVPTMVRRLLEVDNNWHAAPKLRCILVGGAAASHTLLEDCLSRKLPVALTYGLTEAASQVATATPDRVRRKPGTVGKPLMFCEVRIQGSGGQDAKVGEIGEILVSGPTVGLGYLQSSDGGYLAFPNGVLATGDLGYFDETGDLWIVERKDDLIITGGENVYPAEVEQTILAHPAVFEASVTGVLDDEWGQRVAALIVPRKDSKLSADEIIRFCRGRLAGYKIPRLIRFTDILPTGNSGKVQRDLVREVLEAQALSGEVD